MDNRECVSYAAFMVHEEYVSGQVSQDMPYWGGVGDAYEWITDAESAGVPVNQTPKAGDIAIRPASGNPGDVGHAMYVVSVGTLNGQPAIYVQQYNADLRGDYSEGWRTSAGLYFLHFSEW
jgi:surface antigen